jgi:hypothetical protein
MRRQAKNSATSAAPMKIGRYGSSAVRLPIQAPEKPERDQHQRTEAAGRGEDRGEAAGSQCTAAVARFCHRVSFRDFA